MCDFQDMRLYYSLVWLSDQTLAVNSEKWRLLFRDLRLRVRELRNMLEMQQITRCKINKFNLRIDFQDFTITTSELTFLKIGQMLLLTFLKRVTLWLFLVKFVFNQWDKDQ